MRRATVVVMLALSLMAACGGGGESDSSPSAPGDELVTESDPAVPGSSIKSDPAGSDSAPRTQISSATTSEPAAAEPAATAIAFEQAFDDCLASAGVAHDDQIESILSAPSGQRVQMPTFAVDPVAVFGPPAGAWWAVFVAANPQDREFLGDYLPTSTSYQGRDRALLVRGAITGWTGDGTITPTALTADEQAQLEPIAACAEAALANDSAFALASLDPDRPDTVELAGALMKIECEGPDCQVLANEVHFTVPADGAAGALIGTVIYTIQFPAIDGPPGCTNTLTRTIDYVGTVDEAPEGSTISSARWDFHQALDAGLAAPSEPAWAGRVLADGTLHLERTVTPAGCIEGADVTAEMPTLVGYYGPDEQILAAIWKQGPNQYGNMETDYLWAIGDM